MQDLLPPYLDMLIPKLLGLLQQGQKLVQEGALTAMASVADCAKDNFVKYYDQVRGACCLPLDCQCHQCQLKMPASHPWPAAPSKTGMP